MATVEWQTTCRDLQQRAFLLLETQEWSDCTLVVGPEAVPFKAHKLILTMASPVFEAMFANGSTNEQDTYNIPDVKAKPFEALLNYIYTQNININSMKRARKLYLAANRYMIPQLARVCAEYMCSNVTLDSACVIYEAGARYQDQMLMSESMQMIKMHISELLHHKSFEEADMDTVAKIFSCADLKVGEMDLYHALERHVQAHASRKRSAGPVEEENGVETIARPSVRKALKHIRFLTFSLEDYAKGPAKSGFFTKTEALAIMLNIAKADGVPMPPGFSTETVVRYQRPPTPLPVAPVTTSGVLRVTFTQTRSTVSAPCVILGKRWVLKVIPYYCVCIGSNSSVVNLSIYLKCESTDTIPWAYVAHVDFKMLAAKCKAEDSVKHMEKTYTNTHKEDGIDQFTSLAYAKNDENGYVRDGKLSFEANVFLRYCHASDSAATTSSAR